MAVSSTQVRNSLSKINDFKDLNKSFTDRLLKEQEGMSKVPIIIETQEEEDRSGFKTIKRRIAEVKPTKK